MSKNRSMTRQECQNHRTYFCYLFDKGKGRIPLNSDNQIEPWQPIIFEYMGT